MFLTKKERAIFDKIPAESVARHPDVVAAKKKVKAAQAQVEKATGNYRAAIDRRKGWAVRIEGLKAEIVRLQDALPSIALAAFERGDDAPTAAVDCRAKIQRLKWEIEARGDALPAFDATSQIHFGSVVDEANRQLEDAAQELRNSITRTQIAIMNAVIDDDLATVGDWPGAAALFKQLSEA